MLLVDSNKRIKLHEIRQLPWFQKDLPPYLFPGPTSPAAEEDNHEGTGEGGASPSLPVAGAGAGAGAGANGTGAAGGGGVGGSQHAHSHSLWSPEEEKEGLANRRREWVDGLGVVDQEIVDDLCGKIEGLRSDDVWAALQTGGDKELRIAYQLCRDNKRMVEGCELLRFLLF